VKKGMGYMMSSDKFADLFFNSKHVVSL